MAKQMTREQNTTALLVHSRSTSMTHLVPVLRDLGVRFKEIAASEVPQELSRLWAPAVIFTDAEGDWKEVVELAQGALNPAAVIVVSGCDELELCLAALDPAAFEFIPTPIGQGDLAALLSQASGQTAERRRKRLESVLKHLEAAAGLGSQQRAG